MTTRPVLVFDGDCGFCSKSVELLERWVDPDVEITAWQFADLDELGVTPERAAHEVLLVTPTGEVHGGAAAFAKLLAFERGVWSVPGAVMQIPPIDLLAAKAYRLVADNRYKLPGGTPACALPADRRPGAKAD
ncbi:thiol-disulfide oxidoreductase DCC family protein [Yinghuangia sp. YIM S10712]|uniref:thiol-disulfide oxidoreductase DCC family protein n=1 Tax=Yinghuangia sp. YIM S10712 TaxID=3436930 RepID=UPI003F5320C5